MPRNNKFFTMKFSAQVSNSLKEIFKVNVLNIHNRSKIEKTLRKRSHSRPVNMDVY